MSGTNISANPNVPAITQPLANVEALNRVTLQLRQGVQSLAGQIGSPSDRAVTFNDLPTPAMSDTANRTTSLETRMTALEARVTHIEDVLASLPPPP